MYKIKRIYTHIHDINRVDSKLNVIYVNEYT